MIRLVLIFLIVFALFFFGINGYRGLTKKEKWDIIKVLGYSVACSVLTIFVLSLIVIVF